MAGRKRSLPRLAREVGTPASDLAFLQGLLGRVGELLEDPDETPSAAQLANTATKVLGMVQEIQAGQASEATVDLISQLRVVN